MRSEINVPRLIAIVTSLLAAFGILFVLLAVQPDIDTQQERLADAERGLRSDEVVMASMPQLERERRFLSARYDRPEANPDAAFLRTLATVARRRNIRVTSTTFKREHVDATAPDSAPDDSDPDRRFFSSTSVVVTIRGHYAQVLAGISDLSLGEQFVRVEMPTLTRAEHDVVAAVPVTIFHDTAAPV